MKPEETKAALASINSQLEAIEKDVFDYVLAELLRTNPGRNDPAKRDEIFGYYSHTYLIPCISAQLASRVAYVGGHALITQVLALEKKLVTEFHKGALFYDTALACLLSGNEDAYENFLAMTDEEEVKTRGATHQRGTGNLKSEGLAKQTVEARMEFGCHLFNGQLAGCPVDFSFMTGRAPITEQQFNKWRQRLDALHQFELLRIIHDVEVFRGDYYSDYDAAKDNPFIMLRLAKALSHIAQWVESCLTNWQFGAIKESLGPKLAVDPDFGNLLSVAAGNREKFAGKCPHGAAVDVELRQLLTDLAGAPTGVQRQWRLLRILYIVRNSTAHTIEPNLAMYKDRALLLNLLQATFVSVFVICQLKGKPMP